MPTEGPTRYPFVVLGLAVNIYDLILSYNTCQCVFGMCMISVKCIWTLQCYGYDMLGPTGCRLVVVGHILAHAYDLGPIGNSTGMLLLSSFSSYVYLFQ